MSQARSKQALARTIASTHPRSAHSLTATPNRLVAKRHAQQAEQQELLAREFGLIASAPDGIKKIRELILSLGLRGLLGTQQQGEERVVINADISVRSRNVIREIAEVEIPFALPLNWQWARLGQATNFGITEKAGTLSDNTWVLDLEDIEKDTSRLLRRLRYKERPAKSDKNLFKVGDVLYGKLRPYLNKVIVADEDGACTTEILPIRWSREGNPKFLMYALKRSDFLAYVNSKSYGMKMPRLGTTDGINALIPVPPIKEQARIVKKIDELMALCDQMEAQQADTEAAHKTLVRTLLDALTQSQDAADFNVGWSHISENFDTLFNTEASIDDLKQTVLQLAMLGRLVDRASLVERKKTSFEEIITKLNYGTSKKCDYEFSKTPVYRIPNIKDGGIDHGDLKYADFTDDEIETLKLEEGDILIIRSNGSLSIVGQPALVQKKDVSALYAGYLIRIRPDAKRVDAKYLIQFLQSPEARKAIEPLARSTSGVNNINSQHIKSLNLFLPPLAEQRRIVAKVDELMAICDFLKACLAKANILHEQLAATLVKQSVK